MQTYRPDLVALVARETGLTKDDATKLVTSVLSSIVTLAERGPLTIYEFGRFDFKDLKAREIRTAINHDGPVSVPRRKALRFKPAPALVIPME